MWAYEKKLQYPVNIKNPNPTYAKIIISQLGGPDGEVGAAMRYLNQRYSMPNPEIIGILTDVGTCATKNYHIEKTKRHRLRRDAENPLPSLVYVSFFSKIRLFAVAFHKVNKESLLFLFGQSFVTEHEDLGLDLVEGLFTEIANVDKSFVGKRFHNIADGEIACTLQSVCCTHGKFNVIDAGVASLFGVSHANTNFLTDDLINGVKKSVFLCRIVKLHRNFFFSHNVSPFFTYGTKHHVLILS